MHGVLVAELAEFIELDLAFDEFLILARPVVHAFAALAGKFDQLVL